MNDDYDEYYFSSSSITNPLTTEMKEWRGGEMSP